MGMEKNIPVKKVQLMNLMQRGIKIQTWDKMQIHLKALRMVSLQMVCIEIIAVNIGEDVSPGSINTFNLDMIFRGNDYFDLYIIDDQTIELFRRIISSNL
jgi:hypothetical protein